MNIKEEALIDKHILENRKYVLKTTLKYMLLEKTVLDTTASQCPTATHLELRYELYLCRRQSYNTDLSTKGLQKRFEMEIVVLPNTY